MTTDDDKRAETPQPEGESSLFDDLTGVGVIDWRNALVVPALAVFSAMVVGALIIAVTDIDALRMLGSDPGTALSGMWSSIWGAYKWLFLGSLGSLRAVSETLVQATPLILAGLSVAIGFRAGLFNIGAQGQLLVGGMFSLYVGFAFSLPAAIHVPVALLAGMIGGAIWGGIPGLLKARTGAHEVITTIMMNFIALRLVDFYLKSSWYQAAGRDDPVSKPIEVSAQLPRLFGFLERSDVRVHVGIVVALLAAYGVYWLLFKTTVGYEFRAVGSNPHGARYAGMSVTWLIVGVMAVAGALAGLAGSDRILGVLHRGTPGFAGTIGFDAITLALLGRSHPWGVVASGLLFGALRAGGQEMQVNTDISLDLILVIQALVVVFIAAPALIRAIYRVRAAREAERLTTGWST